jgi:DNA-binding CsgD family transcriptional regulator
VEREASPLSDRELQVLRLVAGGVPDKEIAERLNISQRMVRAHLSRICRGLRGTSRANAVAIAISMELIPPVK